MRVLLFNPNTSAAVTDRLAATARAAAPPGLQIEAITAPRGFPYIASRAEAEISGTIVLEALAERRDDYDAALIGAFGDPGVRAARELFDVPIVGLAEAAAFAAALVAERFAIVSFTPLLSHWYLDTIASAGLLARCAGVFTPPDAPGDVADVAERSRERLIEVANRTVAREGVDALILGGAPLAGLAESMQAEVTAALVDPTRAAVGQVALLNAAIPATGLSRRITRPPGKPSTGLAPALARTIARQV